MASNRALESHLLFRAGELAGIIGGSCRGNLDAPICSVVTDSRAATDNSMFVALRGERTDGHRHISEAIRNGARTILAEIAQKDVALASVRSVEGDDGARRVCFIFVDSPLVGLQRAAREYRRRHTLLRIGVTGSSGKTTTKECIAAVMAACYPAGAVAVSPGNLNSDIGLALALFDIRPQHTVGVFEMGINRRGEMDELASMYEPDIAVVTNIGTAHIGMFGSRDEIAREKGKIFSYFDGRQKALLWEDDDYRTYLASKVKGTVAYFGMRSTEGLGRVEDLGLHGWILEWKDQHIDFALPGQHNLLNACAALSVANLLGLDPAKAGQGLSSVRPLFGRSEIRRGKITVLQDYYNANPDSMRAAIEFFAALPSDNRKVFVLGSMLELGEESARAHEEVGLMAGAIEPAAIFLFGDEMAAAQSALRTSAFKGKLFWTNDMDELSNAVVDYVREGDFVLVKGSRGMALERLTRIFEEKTLIAPSESKEGGPHAS
jgi:UDP-N-acetylmuramoyl-tripeptide--D-alanyl-D-alanine ligase